MAQLNFKLTVDGIGICRVPKNHSFDNYYEKWTIIREKILELKIECTVDLMSFLFGFNLFFLGIR